MIIGDLEIRLRSDIARLQRDMNAARGTVDRATAGISRAANAAKVALAGMGMGIGLSQVVALADQYTKFTAQLKLATQSQREYTVAMADVQRISKATEAGISATGVLYARIANATRELGISQTQTAKITETVGLSLKVSGATATEAASAMLQLSQAFGSGVLRGEEFNAVNEAAPRLMQLLADGIGVPIGALRKMAEEGELTSGVLSRVFGDETALAKLRLQGAQIQTISGAYQTLKDTLTVFIGTQAQASGAVSTLTGGISMLANNLGLLSGVIITLAASKLGIWLSGLVTQTYASVVANRALVASNLAAAQAHVVATSAAVALTTARVAELRAAVLAASGDVALTITLNGLIPAQTRAALAAETHAAALAAQTTAMGAASVAGGILRGALAFLGGPIGAVITLLGLGATAWMVWGNKAKEGNELAAESALEASVSIIAALDKQIAKHQAIIDMRKQGATLDQANKNIKSSEALKALSLEISEINNGAGKYASMSKDDKFFAREKALKNILEITTKIRIEETKGAQASALTNGEARLKFMGDYATKQEQMIAKLAEARKLMGAAFTPEDEARIRAHYAEKTGGAAKAQAAIQKEATAYAALSASVRTKIAESQLELAIGHDATEAQKIRIKLDQDIAAGRVKMSAAHRAALDLDIEALDIADGVIASQKRAAEGAADMAKIFKSHQDEVEKSIQSAIEEADKNEELARTFGMTRGAIEAMELARLKDQLAQRSSTAMTWDEIEALKALIAAKERSAAAAGSIDALEAEKKFNKDRLTEQKKTVEKYDDIFRTGFADMVNGGKNTWKSFTTSLATTFKTSVADQIYKMFAQPFVVKFVASMMGIVGGAASGVASAATSGGISGGINMISAGKTIWDGFAGGMSSSIGGVIASTGSALGLSAVSAFGSGMGMGVASASAATAAGAVSAGVGITGTAAAATTAGAAIGAAIPYVAVALAIAKVLQLGFGHGERKTTSQGIEGSFGADGFTGTKFRNWKEEGGWFSSDRRGKQTPALDATTQKQFSDGFATLKSVSSDFARSLGLDAISIASYSEKISVTLTGKAEEDNASIVKLFSDLGDRLATAVAPGIAIYSRENETASATLQRLSVSLSAANGMLDTLNLSLYETSLAGGDMASSLIDLFGGLQNMVTVSAGYFQSFYSEQEKVDIATRQLGKTFSDLGFVMPVTNAELRKQIEAQDLTTEAGRKSYAQLMGLSGAFASLTGATEQLAASAAASATAVAEAAAAAAQAAADAARAAAQAASDASAQAYDDAKSATNAALQAVQRAIAAEKSRIGVIRDVAAESVRSITTVFDLLKEQVSQLYGSVGGTSAMQASQGNAFIDSALQNVLSTGYLPDQKELQAAISAARGGLDSSQFATQIEADRAALIMAGKLSQMQTAGGYQLTAAERSLQAANEQLDALDAQLVYAQQQVDALNGINISVLSVTAAIAGLAAAMAAQKSAAVPSGGTVPMPANPSTIYEGMGSDITTIQDLYTVNLGRVGEASGIDYWTQQFMADGVISTEEKQAFALAAMPEYKAKYGFAVGTNYVPYDMIAQIHEGEAVVPRAYNPAAGGGNNAELLEELRAQRAENREMSQRLDAALYAIAKHTMHTADTIDAWDGAGMPDVRVDA